MCWWKNYWDAASIALYRAVLPSALTEPEVQAIQNIIELPSGAIILDVCCGYGRHLLPLTKRGYRVIGIDISLLALREATAQAQSEDIWIDVVQADMRYLPFTSHFDAAILMFNSFGVFSDERDNKVVLIAITQVLKTGGYLLLDILNRSYCETLFDRHPKQETFRGHGVELRVSSRLDPNTGILHQELRWLSASGEHSTYHALRLYTRQDIEQLLMDCGFEHLRFHSYDDLLGRPYKDNQTRILVRGIFSK